MCDSPGVKAGRQASRGLYENLCFHFHLLVVSSLGFPTEGQREYIGLEKCFTLEKGSKREQKKAMRNISMLHNF